MNEAIDTPERLAMRGMNDRHSVYAAVRRSLFRPLIEKSYSGQLRYCDASLRLRWPWGRLLARRHGLPGELVVSITSYPERFHALEKTLKCLLTQSVRPDRVVLWIADGDHEALPDVVTSLARKGLEIRLTRDVKSYKKIIPALVAFPEAFIATADDDVFYDFGWLGALVKGWMKSENAIVCHRAHRIRLNDDGIPLPYMSWDFELDSPECSAYVFPTGCGGALYPPRALHPDVVREDLFKTLSPTSDDMWLYCMGRRAGRRFSKVGGAYAAVNWPDTQEVALARENQMGGNDRQLRAILEHYGMMLTTH